MDSLLLLAELSQFDEPTLSKIAKGLPDDRRDRANRAKNPIARASEILAYALLAYGVKQLLPEESMPTVAYGEFGKPYFPEHSLAFSITHSRHAVAVLLSKAFGEVGIDLEEIRPLREALVQRIAGQSELCEIHSDADAIALWTKKEAFAKREGKGLRGDLREIPTDDTRTVFLASGETRFVLSVSPVAALTRETRQTVLSPSELLNGLCGC